MEILTTLGELDYTVILGVAVVILLTILVLKKTKLATYAEFANAGKSKNSNVFDIIISSIGKSINFIFSPIMLLIIVFIGCTYTTSRTITIGSEIRCGKIVEYKQIKSQYANPDMLEEKDYDEYYDNFIYFEIGGDSLTKQLNEVYVDYEEYVLLKQDINAKYCDDIYSSDFWMYLIISIALVVFMIGILIYNDN